MRILAALLVILFLLLQYDLWVGDGSLATVWHLRKELAAQQEENTRLEQRNMALDAEVLDLKQGLDAVEERARDELGMIKDGEVFIQLVGDKPPPADPGQK